jgi:hypothetical protein
MVTPRGDPTTAPDRYRDMAARERPAHAPETASDGSSSSARRHRRRGVNFLWLGVDASDEISPPVVDGEHGWHLPEPGILEFCGDVCEAVRDDIDFEVFYACPA